MSTRPWACSNHVLGPATCPQRRMLSESVQKAEIADNGVAGNDVSAPHCNRWDICEAVSKSIFEGAGGESQLGPLTPGERVTHLVTKHNWHPLVALKVSERFGTAGASPPPVHPPL